MPLVFQGKPQGKSADWLEKSDEKVVSAQPIGEVDNSNYLKTFPV